MGKILKEMLCKKDEGGLNQILVEGGLAVVGVALVVVLAVSGKPVVEEIVSSCGQRVKEIFTMF